MKSVLLSGVMLLGLAASAQAETLTQALIAAYRHNPALNADRARQRVNDENVPQALSGWRPTVNMQTTVSKKWADTTLSPLVETNPVTLNIALTQPIFNGFKTVESTKYAEAGVKAGRQQLLATEQTVLLSAITAYVDVLRDRRILELRKSNVRILQDQARAIGERFKAGELTKTDVSQARASVAGAQSALAIAVANLKGSEASYEQYIGHAPRALARAPMAKPPASLDASLRIAQQTNPAILQAAQSVEQADHYINVVGSDLLPEVHVQGSYFLGYNQSSTAFSPNEVRQAEISGVLNVPLYEGGRVYSAVRAAKQGASQSRLKVIDAVRAVRQGVAVAWSGLIANGQSVLAGQTQVSASQLALDGVRQEFAVGSRSTVDVLNAQQALLNAQVSEVSAQHDKLLASYRLQSAMGHLTAKHLHLGALYDPTEYYNDVRNKWIGLDAETVK